MNPYFEAECPNCGATVASMQEPEGGSVSLFCDEEDCETDFDVTLEGLGEFEEEDDDEDGD